MKYYRTDPTMNIEQLIADEYYKPSKNKAVAQDVVQPTCVQKQTKGQDMETLTQKVAIFMEQNNITDLEEFLSAMTKKSNMQM